jgi:hypothetical protein
MKQPQEDETKEITQLAKGQNPVEDSLAGQSAPNVPQLKADDAPPQRYRILKNGATYDMELKRIVANPGGGKAAITPATASAMQARRQELKRAALVRGALNGTRDILQREPVHELEWLEVIGEANMHRAADPGNAKGVDASRLLIQEAGLAEAQARQEQADDPLRDALVTALVEYARRAQEG